MTVSNHAGPAAKKKDDWRHPDRVAAAQFELARKSESKAQLLLVTDKATGTPHLVRAKHAAEAARHAYDAHRCAAHALMVAGGAVARGATDTAKARLAVGAARNAANALGAARNAARHVASMSHTAYIESNLYAERSGYTAARPTTQDMIPIDADLVRPAAARGDAAGVAAVLHALAIAHSHHACDLHNVNLEYNQAREMARVAHDTSRCAQRVAHVAAEALDVAHSALREHCDLATDSNPSVVAAAIDHANHAAYRSIEASGYAVMSADASIAAAQSQADLLATASDKVHAAAGKAAEVAEEEKVQAP